MQLLSKRFGRENLGLVTGELPKKGAALNGRSFVLPRGLANATFVGFAPFRKATAREQHSVC
jgi:hypothetical protein